METCPRCKADLTDQLPVQYEFDDGGTLCVAQVMCCPNCGHEYLLSIELPIREERNDAA